MATQPPLFDALLDELRSCGDEFERFFDAQCAELQQAESKLQAAPQAAQTTAAENDELQRMLAEQMALRHALEDRVEGYFHQIEAMQAEMEGLAGRSSQQRSDDEDARQRLTEQLRDVESQRDAVQCQLSAAELVAAEASRRLHELEAEFAAHREERTREALAATQMAADHAAQMRHLEVALAEAQAKAGSDDASALSEMRTEKEELIARLATLERERVGWLSERRIARAQANTVTEQAAKLAAAQDQLQQARSQLADERHAVVNQQQLAEVALARRAEQIERELADMQRDLGLARAQAARADQTAVALASARSELAETRTKLNDARDELQRMRSQTTSVAPVVNPQQVSELEHERALLESELEMIRNRAAELTETLADEKRRMAHERSEWTSELKEIRTTLASQATGPEAPAAGNRVAQSAAALRPGLPSGDSGAHAVLDTVMAQFEMLQKDRRRRGQQDVA